MTKTDRNSKISEILNDHLTRAQNDDTPAISTELSQNLDNIFSTTTWGYREILLVIIIGRMLDPSFKASSAFYDCNPRAIYEGPIREFLIANGIPNRKSGPLNVAKAAIGINEQWAAQRRPAAIAKDVVEVVNLLDDSNMAELEQILTVILRRFLVEATRVESLTVEVPPQSDPEYLYETSTVLINDVPDGGNTPQKIVGMLMQTYHDDLQSGIVVHGYEDSASVTNTTSKKPGDVTEELLDGTIVKVYEVTVKKFDLNRIVESYESVKEYCKHNDAVISEVTVICRKQDTTDVLPESGEVYFGKYIHQDVIYHFIDLNNWILSQLMRMSQDARTAFFEALSGYISEVNTAEKVKIRWNDLNSPS